MVKRGKLQKDFHKLMERSGGRANYDINVGNFFRVVRYYETTHRADIQLQVDDAGGQDEVGIINDCPVLYQCYNFDNGKSLKEHAIVFVVFNDRDLDNFSGGKYTKASDRTHDVNDAVVVGVWK